MEITWHVDETQPQKLVLTIEGICYGRWKERWAKYIKSRLDVFSYSRGGAEIRETIARLESELGWEEALNLLARRACFSTEVRCKLEDAGCSLDVLGVVLEKCHRAGLLNDEERTQRMMEIWAKKGYGPMRIRLELKKRAVPIPKSLESHEHSTYLLRYVTKRLTPQATQAEKAKVIRALLRRGFSLDAIYAVLPSRR